MRESWRQSWNRIQYGPDTGNGSSTNYPIEEESADYGRDPALPDGWEEQIEHRDDRYICVVSSPDGKLKAVKELTAQDLERFRDLLTDEQVAAIQQQIDTATQRPAVIKKLNHEGGATDDDEVERRNQQISSDSKKRKREKSAARQERKAANATPSESVPARQIDLSTLHGIKTRADMIAKFGEPVGYVGSSPYWKLPSGMAAILDKTDPKSNNPATPIVIQENGFHKFKNDHFEYKNGEFHNVPDDEIRSRREASATEYERNRRVRRAEHVPTEREQAPNQAQQQANQPDQNQQRARQGTERLREQRTREVAQTEYRNFRKDGLPTVPAIQAAARGLNDTERAAFIDWLRDRKVGPAFIHEAFNRNQRGQMQEADRREHTTIGGARNLFDEMIQDGEDLGDAYFESKRGLSDRDLVRFVQTLRNRLDVDQGELERVLRRDRRFERLDRPRNERQPQEHSNETLPARRTRAEIEASIAEKQELLRKLRRGS